MFISRYLFLHFTSSNFCKHIVTNLFMHFTSSIAMVSCWHFQPFGAYLQAFFQTCVHMFDTYRNFIRQCGHFISPTSIFKLVVGNFSTGYRHFSKSTAYPICRIDVSVFCNLNVRMFNQLQEFLQASRIFTLLPCGNFYLCCLVGIFNQLQAFLLSSAGIFEA